MNQEPVTILLSLLASKPTTTARALLDDYHEKTGNRKRALPRMALLELIADGKVEWGDNGKISLIP